MELLVVILVLVVLPFASIHYGTDSRPEFDERPHGERFGALQ